MTDQWAKVLFDLDSSDWHGTGGETLWAAPIVGSEWRSFRLMNSPFFARGVSYQDVVSAMPIADSYNVFSFTGVVERGGHSTYMIIALADKPRLSAYWTPMERIGCSYEGSETHWEGRPRPLWSIDVPPPTDLHEVYELLERGEHDKVWLFQEGYAYLSSRDSAL
jgi:hypothetical protein